MNTINEKIEIKTIVPPGLVCPNKVLNSLCKVFIKLVHINDHRDGIVQYRYGISIRPKNVDSQLRERLKIDDKGSNLENRLVIIFKLIFGLNLS